LAACGDRGAAQPVTRRELTLQLFVEPDSWLTKCDTQLLCVISCF